MEDVPMRLAGKRVLITGAASGIGLACAHGMTAQGARVIGGDIDGPALAAAADGAGMAATIPMDVAAEQDWMSAVAQARRQLGGPDALIHSAGLGVGGHLTNLPLESWRRQPAVHLAGAFLALKPPPPLPRDSGGGSLPLIAA